MKKFEFTKLLPFLIMLPAILVGSIVMLMNDVPITIWSQNLIVLVLAGLLINYISDKVPVGVKKIAIPVIIILLILTFLHTGLGGVHRWIGVGLIKFYIASIVIPVLLIELWRLSQVINIGVLTVIALGVSVMLFLQPDASQTTAFTVPMVVILLSKTRNRYYRYSVITFAALLCLLSWILIDALPPVPYVEGIIDMAANTGMMWRGLGIVSLAILPLPFILFPPRNARLISLCLGSYFVLILLSTRFGNFPVPLMGYGISPILGYYLAVTWLIKEQK